MLRPSGMLLLLARIACAVGAMGNAVACQVLVAFHDTFLNSFRSARAICKTVPQSLLCSTMRHDAAQVGHMSMLNDRAAICQQARSA